jgi:hypothetical protein
VVVVAASLVPSVVAVEQEKTPRPRVATVTSDHPAFLWFMIVSRSKTVEG